VLLIFGGIAMPNVMALSAPDRSNTSSLLFVVGVPMMSMLPFLVGQVKMQFAHPRARLMPHFLPAHLLVLSSLLLCVMVLYPLAMARIAGAEPLGLLAMTLAIGAPAIWGAHINRFWPMLIAMAAFFSLMSEQGKRWWITDASQHRAVHVVILIAGIVWICVWLKRLCVLDEESEDYQNNYQAMLARRTGSEAIEQRRVVANAFARNRMMSRVGDWWHSRLGGYFGGNTFGLVRLLRYGAAATPAEVNSLFMLAIFVAYAVFLTQFTSLAGSSGAISGVWFFVMFLIFLPGMMAGELLAQRRPRIANELFLPVSREQLMDGLFAASAYNSLIQWLIMNVGLAVLVISMRVDVTLQTAVMYVLLSAATTLASMAISVRIAIWPSRMKRFFVAWVTWLVLLPPIALWWTQREKFGDAPFLVAAGILMAVAAIVMQRARNAWLQLELG
jgi:hypothetical protein